MDLNDGNAHFHDYGAIVQEVGVILPDLEPIDWVNIPGIDKSLANGMKANDCKGHFFAR